MTRKLAILATTLAAVIGSASFASAASAHSAHSASCGWPTNHAWFYSPAYNESLYYVGHYVTAGGVYYRQFAAHTPNRDQWLHYDYVYCG